MKHLNRCWLIFFFKFKVIPAENRNRRNVWPPCNKNSDDPVYVDGTTRFQHFLHNEKADVRKIKNEHVKLVNRLLFSFHNFFSVCRIITTLVFSSTSISVATLFSFAFSSSYFFYSDSDDRSLLFQSIFKAFLW